MIFTLNSDNFIYLLINTKKKKFDEVMALIFD